MNFRMLLQLAKEDAPYAINKILALYRPLMIKESIIDGVFDEDLYQEFSVLLIYSIRRKNIYAKCND